MFDQQFRDHCRGLVRAASPANDTIEGILSSALVECLAHIDKLEYSAKENQSRFNDLQIDLNAINKAYNDATLRVSKLKVAIDSVIQVL